MFGIIGDKFLTHLFLSLKYFIFVCRFQKKKTTFIGFKAHIKFNRETEYFIAKNKGNCLPIFVNGDLIFNYYFLYIYNPVWLLDFIWYMNMFIVYLKHFESCVKMV